MLISPHELCQNVRALNVAPGTHHKDASRDFVLNFVADFAIEINGTEMTNLAYNWSWMVECLLHVDGTFCRTSQCWHGACHYLWTNRCFHWIDTSHNTGWVDVRSVIYSVCVITPELTRQPLTWNWCHRFLIWWISNSLLKLYWWILHLIWRTIPTSEIILPPFHVGPHVFQGHRGFGEITNRELVTKQS